MRKHTTFIVALFALSMLAFYSCKKSSSPSPSSILTSGTWKQTGEAVDSNNSGTINYTLPTDTSWAHQILTFNSNGTFLNTYYSSVTQGSWTLVDNNSYIKVVDTGSNGGTNYFQVLTLNSTTFEIKDTTRGQISTQTFTKQ